MYLVKIWRTPPRSCYMFFKKRKHTPAAHQIHFYLWNLLFYTKHFRKVECLSLSRLVRRAAVEPRLGNESPGSFAWHKFPVLWADVWVLDLLRLLQPFNFVLLLPPVVPLLLLPLKPYLPGRAHCVHIGAHLLRCLTRVPSVVVFLFRLSPTLWQPLCGLNCSLGLGKSSVRCAPEGIWQVIDGFFFFSLFSWM